MPLKKQPLNDNEIPIYDEALIYQRGEYWQMRMWLTKEKKYARFSLRTRNRDTAIDKAIPLLICSLLAYQNFHSRRERSEITTAYQKTVTTHYLAQQATGAA